MQEVYLTAFLASVSEHMEKLEPSCAVGGGVRGAGAVESREPVPWNARHRLAVGSSSSASEYTPKRMESRVVHGCL